MMFSNVVCAHAAGEALAFATLATEGARVRLSGQDSERGTFSHRHAVLHDARTGRRYMPFQNLAPDQMPVEVFNSPLLPDSNICSNLRQSFET